jgi:hypothetical protein
MSLYLRGSADRWGARLKLKWRRRQASAPEKAIIYMEGAGQTVSALIFGSGAPCPTAIFLPLGRGSVKYVDRHLLN